MAYLDTYTPITVANSKAFNDGADFNRPELMGGSVISMAPAGRSLSDLLKGFDEPGPPPVTPGSFVRSIEAEANAWGQQFGQTVAQAQQEAASYWATPVATQPVRQAPAAPSMIEGVGNLADSFVNSVTGTKPALAEQGVEMASLSNSFGSLSNSEPSAFERRYQQTQPRRNNGNDYV